MVNGVDKHTVAPICSSSVQTGPIGFHASETVRLFGWPTTRVGLHQNRPSYSGHLRRLSSRLRRKNYDPTKTEEAE